MRLARKLLLLATMVIAALAMTAGSANAQIHIEEEDPAQQCPALNIITPHNITGGCHVEFESTEEVPLVANPTGTPMTVMACEWHLEAQLRENGEGYVTRATLTGHATGVPCTRRPCQEVTAGQPNEMIPWEVHIRELAGEESLETRFCLEPLAAPPGTNQGNCTVHLEVSAPGSSHNYRIGHPEPNPNHEAFCEPGDAPFPVSIRHANFVYETDPNTTEERIEIVH